MACETWYPQPRDFEKYCPNNQKPKHQSIAPPSHHFISTGMEGRGEHNANILDLLTLPSPHRPPPQDEQLQRGGQQSRHGQPRIRAFLFFFFSNRRDGRRENGGGDKTRIRRGDIFFGLFSCKPFSIIPGYTHTHTNTTWSLYFWLFFFFWYAYTYVQYMAHVYICTLLHVHMYKYYIINNNKKTMTWERERNLYL